MVLVCYCIDSTTPNKAVQTIMCQKNEKNVCGLYIVIVCLCCVVILEKRQLGGLHFCGRSRRMDGKSGSHFDAI